MRLGNPQKLNFIGSIVNFSKKNLLQFHVRKKQYKSSNHNYPTSINIKDYPHLMLKFLIQKLTIPSSSIASYWHVINNLHESNQHFYGLKEELKIIEIADNIHEYFYTFLLFSSLFFHIANPNYEKGKERIAWCQWCCLFTEITILSK